MQIVPGPPARPPVSTEGGLVTAGAYLMLFVLGAAQAAVGSFFYSVGPVPLAALGFALLILVTGVLGGWGMLRPSGALAAASGWFIAAFGLTNGTAAGSVIIANTAAGEWFLFGGSAAAIAGIVAAFVLWSNPARSRRRPR